METINDPVIAHQCLRNTMGLAPLTIAPGGVVPSIVTGWFKKTVWVRADYYIALQGMLIEANNRLLEAGVRASSADEGKK